MNPIDIRKPLGPDLAGSYAAMQRAARSAQDLAIQTKHVTQQPAQLCTQQVRPT